MHLRFLFHYQGNPFDEKESIPKNLATGASLTEDSKSFLLSCVKKGEEAYQKFVNERLNVKSVKLFDKIQKARPGKKKVESVRSIFVFQR